jgi:Na+/proline symporter
VLSGLDAAILGAFLAYCLASGLRSRALASQSLEQYFLAGRTLPGWKAGISMAATQFAADTPLLVTGMIAMAGIFSLWRLWIYALAFLLLGFLLAGAWRRAGVLTDAELAELRYGGRLATVLRTAKALYFGTLFNCAVMAMVLYASIAIAEPFLRWEEWLPAPWFEGFSRLLSRAGVPLPPSSALSVLVVVAVTAAYSTTGGLRAVVNTDLVQFAVAILASAIYAVVVVRLVGGLGELGPRLEALYGAAWSQEALAFTPTRAREAGWVVLGTIAIQWIAQMNADGTGYLAQRAMACRSDRDARHAALVFVVAQVLVRSLLWIPIGLALLVLFPMEGDAANAAARERTFVEGIALHLPAGVRGLMLTGMLAALASTLDSHLNWGASYWTNDLYKRLLCQAWWKREPSGRELVWVARASNLIVLAVSIAILTRLTSIESAWKTSLLLGAGMGGPLLLRWLWWRMTAGAELAAIAVSSLLAPLLLLTVESEGARMLLISLAATGAAVGVSLFSRGEPMGRLCAFYRRVHPPGFWGPVALACGHPPARAAESMRRGALATAGLSLAVFCLLVGVGSWLFGSPAPTWFPWRGPWIALLLTTAVALLVALRAEIRGDALAGSGQPEQPRKPALSRRPT